MTSIKSTSHLMASCLSLAKEMEMKSTTVPNWLELPREVTQNILKRVGVVEIVTSACLVCPLWWSICKDPLMWHTIDMGDHRTSSYDLAKILLYAIDRSCGQVEDIDIAEFCSNQIVESLYHLSSRLMARIRPDFLDKGWSEVTKELPLSGEPEFLYNKDIIGIIGGSCPLLKSLKLGSISDDDAFAISKTMSGIRHLKIFGGQITEAGLLAILKGCPHLETLHLQDCSNLDLSESLEKRCRDKIKDFMFLKVESNQYDFSHLLGGYEDFEDYDPNPFFENF